MKKLSWTGPHAALKSAETYLFEFCEVEALSLRRLDGDQEAFDGEWTLEAYVETEPDLASVNDAIAAMDPSWRDVPACEIEELPDVDWVAHSLEGLGVVEAGRFVLYGVHDADNLPDNQDAIPIRIDANQAFGTGHHPTTAGCLTLLDRFAGAPAASILDLGCGSGVLAIAAAKLWDERVLAVDIDPKSVEIGLNGVADMIDFVASDGLAAPEVAAKGPFDFIFANILAGPLVEFAPAIAKALTAPGRVMLAGLMSEQEEAVTAAYEAQGMRRINRLDHETWPVLLFVKTSHGAA